MPSRFLNPNCTLLMFSSSFLYTRGSIILRRILSAWIFKFMILLAFAFLGRWMVEVNQSLESSPVAKILLRTLVITSNWSFSSSLSISPSILSRPGNLLFLNYYLLFPVLLHRIVISYSENPVMTFVNCYSFNNFSIYSFYLSSIFPLS